MKKLIAFLLALTCLLSLCACGQPETPTEPTEPDYTASEADINQLEKLYEGRQPYHGELHDHADTGGTSDGKMKLEDWKKSYTLEQTLGKAIIMNMIKTEIRFWHKKTARA